MADRLAGGNVAIASLANALATGGVLLAVILAFGPISGAHFNPVVTVSDAIMGGIAWREVPAYIVAQLVGAVAALRWQIRCLENRSSFSHIKRGLGGRSSSANSSPRLGCSRSSGAARATART